MTEEEIMKFLKLAIGPVSATGSHGKDMDMIVPNVDLLGRVTVNLMDELVGSADSWENRCEISIRAVGEKAREWVDFIEVEVLDIKKDQLGRQS